MQLLFTVNQHKGSRIYSSGQRICSSSFALYGIRTITTDGICPNRCSVNRAKIPTCTTRTHPHSFRHFRFCFFVSLFFFVFHSGYKNPPLVKYTFESGNEEGAFEIRFPGQYKAEVWQTHSIMGPKSYRLRFVGEVVENGVVISKYINNMYVFVSSHKF